MYFEKRYDDRPGVEIDPVFHISNHGRQHSAAALQHHRRCGGGQLRRRYGAVRRRHVRFAGDAVSGTVLSFDYDAENYTPPTNGNAIGSVIGEAEAKSIALVQISGASEKNVVRVKLDKDDGLWEYEDKVIYNEVEYEIEINA